MSERTKMMSLKVMAIVSPLVFAYLASMTVLVPQHSPSTMTAYAQQPQSFTAKLSGKDEVPPVNTQGTGTAQFQLSSDGKEINYDLTTTNLNGFMMAHIHKGKSGENGQPVTTPLQMGKGKITSSDLQGPLAGKQMSDLVDLMKNSGAYVNVHTNQNQNGEIRGQIMNG
ncbi:MAG TPA: CHRD domain-containing protein [Nitrososphaeraceae archaeon]|nr:CHRD domain-containing protein [Nitrososphaeraceae archaeon]